jgi:hypothetical protein
LNYSYPRGVCIGLAASEFFHHTNYKTTAWSIRSWMEAYKANSLFGWLVADGWCWFVLREEYCWLVAGGWFVLREKYCWLVADKPSEQALSWNCSGNTVLPPTTQTPREVHGHLSRIETKFVKLVKCHSENEFGSIALQIILGEHTWTWNSVSKISPYQPADIFPHHRWMS